MKQICLSLLFVVYVTSVFAQKTFSVNGKVHRESGEAISHVTIKISGTSLVSITNEQGRYSFPTVPQGKYTLFVSSVEIEPRTLQIDVNKNYPDLHIHVGDKGDVSLDEVRVTRNTAKREIETSGFAVNVVETKEAALRNMQTNELLDRTVGVRVRQNGGLGSDVQYNLNGMSGRSVGIFIDGIEISTYGSSFNLNSIPPAMIERVEVYKGVLPAHLSGDLMGGAVNVVLKKGFSQNNLTAALSYGAFNTFQSDLSGQYRNPKNGLTFRAAAFLTKTDNSYKIWGKFARNTLPDLTMEQVVAKRFWDEYKSYGGRFEVGFTDVKWADQFFVGYNGSDTYKEIQHGQTMGKPYMGRFAEYQGHVFSLNYLKRDLFVDGLQLNINANYSNRETYIQDTVSWVYNWSGEKMIGFHGNPIKTRDGAQQGEPTMNTINREIITTRTNLNYAISSNHSVSLNHVFNTVNRDDNDALKVTAGKEFRSDSDLGKHVFALNYEAQWMGDKLKSNVFTKLYKQNATHWAPSYRMENGAPVFYRLETQNNKSTMGYGLALSYELKSNVVLIGSTERAVRMPSDSEIFGGADENTLANLGLRPEVSDNVNLGIKLGSFDFSNHKFSFSGNGFLRNMKDRIMRRASESRNDELPEATPFVNIGVAQAVGFEGELGYTHNNNLHLILNFSRFSSLYKVKYDPATGGVLDKYNKQLPNEPFFTANGSVQYTFNNLLQKNSNMNVYYNAGFVEEFYIGWLGIEQELTPKQFYNDIGLSYRFPNRKIVASLDAKNIFNAEIYDNFAVQKPGRAFYLKINYTISKF